MTLEQAIPTLRAGVARANITPPVACTWQGGYGGRTQPAQGIHDHLTATALVVEGPAAGGEAPERIALVSLDLVGLAPEQVARIRALAQELVGVHADHLMLCCSHTHGGPATRQSGPWPVNDVYIAALEQAVAGAIYEAAQRLEPVTLAFGHALASFNVNRRLRQPDGQMTMRPNPAGAVDRSVVVLRLDRHRQPESGMTAGEGGSASPLAVLFRFACHATAMGGQNYLITADYPGAARRFVERTYGGRAGPTTPFLPSTTAMFLPGCFGNLRPNLTTAQGGFRSGTWEEVEALGRQLGAATVQAAESANNPTANRHWSREDGPAASGPLPAMPLGAASATVELRLEANPAGRPSWPAEVQVLRLGSAYLVGLPGEVFVEIGYRAQHAVADALAIPTDRVLVQGYSNGSIGYVPTAAAILEGGYEVGAWKNSDRPAGFTGEAETLLAETAAKLAVQLQDEKGA